MDKTHDDASTAIFDVAHACLEAFDRVVAEHDDVLLSHSFISGKAGDDVDNRRRNSSCDFLGLRNSFLFWIDYTGALSLMSSSLDSRLRGLADISAMVIELLEMVLRNLHRIDRKPLNLAGNYADPMTVNSDLDPKFLAKWEDACRAVDTAMDRLHFVAMAIRKASAKKIGDTVTNFVTEEDVAFRRDIALWVRYRFPAARRGLCQQLGDSIAVRRRLLLQTKRHAKKLAVRRPLPQAPKGEKRDIMDTSPTTDQHTKNKTMVVPSIMVSGVTKASRPDPQAPVLKLLHRPKPRALTTVISTISTTQEDSFDYPPPPVVSEGETRAQCPFCLLPLERKQLEKWNDHWKRHVDEHLKPYSCLFPKCAESLVVFTRRNEWKAHMESTHSRDWLRKVHATVWHCDLGHDPPEMFETEAQWREHMMNLESHPGRKQAAPTQAQLDALSPRKQQAALREKFVCPLCEQIPEKIRGLIEKGRGDATDMYNYVVDHVANHLKSLSLMAVPSLETTTPENRGLPDESVVMMKDSFNRPLNENSVPHPPSGKGHLDEVSLPPDAWSDLHRDNIGAVTRSSTDSFWDKEYLDYTHPEEAPEPVDQEWFDHWKSWKRESDPYPPHSFEADPILADLLKAKNVASPSVSGQQADFGEFVFGVDTQDALGRTRLSFAAEDGDLASAQLLLDKGADIEMADHDGHTPLLFAASNDHEAVVRLLLDEGARLEAADQIYGRTPLSWAASKGHETVVRLLLDRGAEVDAADNSRRTPLSWAASRGHDDVVRLLIDHGADIELSDPKYGRTPLSWAAARGHDATADAAVLGG
ncbi:hypothetical protein GE09DRAFT_1248057 [Coniochaeta sp. 2T2.1]|nr:hypothetical protein GE09DRAFT_1248057 [Coniochaeta sp. 2T2.1]